MKIRQKIFSVVLIVIILELAVSFCGVYFLGALNKRLSGVVQVDFEEVKLTGLLNSDLLEIQRAQKNLLITHTQEEAGRYINVAAGFKAALQDNLSKIYDLAEEQERTLITRLRSRIADYLTVIKDIENLVMDRLETLPVPGNADSAAKLVVNLDDAIALSTGSARSAFADVTLVLNDLTDHFDRDLKTSRSLGTRYFNLATTAMIILSAFSIIVGLLIGLFLARSIAGNLRSVAMVTDSIAGGELDAPVEVSTRDEIGDLASSVRRMQAALQSARDEASARDWLKNGIAQMNDAMRGRVNTFDLCSRIISEIAGYAGAPIGAIFLPDGSNGEELFKLAVGYAYKNNGFPDSFAPGEGFVGQAALERRRIVVHDLPPEYVKVYSGLGDSAVRCLVITPLLYEKGVKGVVELGFLTPPAELQFEYLEQIMPSIAVNLETARKRGELARALARSQALTAELQQQQEEIEAANEELEEQTQLLKQSEEKLRAQQEELEESNVELEQKNEYLELQKRATEQANEALERAGKELEEKAGQLAVSSKYKSEFLANISHELRTPLNSMLLLAGFLSENKEKNLTEDQVRSAEIIHKSGNDLLSLINEILDLARIEAGRMEIRIGRITVRELTESVSASFKPLADEKGLNLSVTLKDGCPNEIWSDRKRIEQILRNLISNAVKFTDRGGVEVLLGRAEQALNFDGAGKSREALSVSIRDTGPGIPLEKQQVIFEAFQQLEGGTSRTYGGTGLGLSISRELARLLGGEITLISEEGKGAAFTLVLPVGDASATVLSSSAVQAAVPPAPKIARPAFSFPEHGLQGLPDDREGLTPDQKSVLLIEDDRNFAEILMRQCRRKDFKCLHAMTGEEGLALAEQYLPKGIILDIRLPGKDGWCVLEELKESTITRHIPVHIISVDEADMEAYNKGAVGFLTKPARSEDLDAVLLKLEQIFSRKIKDLLVVEDDENLRKGIVKLLGNGDVQAVEATCAGEAIRAIRSSRYDCMILDLGLPDQNGLDMLRQLEADKDVVVPPVIVYTGRDLTSDEEAELLAYSESIIVKGVKSEERLLDEASLFLHRMVDRMSIRNRQIITNLHDTDFMFQGKRVLLVDDDMRNVFALAKILDEKGMKIFKAENGEMALRLLEKHQNIDLVLMDIMMPVMDGYETIKRIRARDCFKKLPIIALTAKAMKQDRERCITAGASDYLSKPVDTRRLFSMMRIWMYR